MHRPNGACDEIAEAVRRHPAARSLQPTPPSANSCPTEPETITTPATLHHDVGFVVAAGSAVADGAEEQLDLFAADILQATCQGHFDADFELDLALADGVGDPLDEVEPEENSSLGWGIAEGPPSAIDAGGTVLFRRAGARYVPWCGGRR